MIRNEQQAQEQENRNSLRQQATNRANEARKSEVQKLTERLKQSNEEQLQSNESEIKKDLDKSFNAALKGLQSSDAKVRNQSAKELKILQGEFSRLRGVVGADTKQTLDKYDILIEEATKSRNLLTSLKKLGDSNLKENGVKGIKGFLKRFGDGMAKDLVGFNAVSLIGDQFKEWFPKQRKLDEQQLAMLQNLDGNERPRPDTDRNDSRPRNEGNNERGDTTPPESPNPPQNAPNPVIEPNANPSPLLPENTPPTLTQETTEPNGDSRPKRERGEGNQVGSRPKRERGEGNQVGSRPMITNMMAMRESMDRLVEVITSSQRSNERPTQTEGADPTPSTGNTNRNSRGKKRNPIIIEAPNFRPIEDLQTASNKILESISTSLENDSKQQKEVLTKLDSDIEELKKANESLLKMLQIQQSNLEAANAARLDASRDRVAAMDDARENRARDYHPNQNRPNPLQRQNEDRGDNSGGFFSNLFGEILGNRFGNRRRTGLGGRRVGLVGRYLGGVKNLGGKLLGFIKPTALLSGAAMAGSALTGMINIPKLTENIVGGIKTLGSWIAKPFTFIGGLIAGSVESVKGAGKSIKTGFKGLLKGGMAIPVIGQILQIVSALYDFGEGVFKADTILEKEKDKLTVMDRIGAGIARMAGGFLSFFQTIANWILNPFGVNIDVVKGIEKQIATLMTTDIFETWRDMKSGAGMLYDDTKKLTSDSVDWVVDKFKSAKDITKNFISSMIESMLDSLKQIKDNIKNMFTDMIKNVVKGTPIEGMVDSWLGNKVEPKKEEPKSTVDSVFDSVSKFFSPKVEQPRQIDKLNQKESELNKMKQDTQSPKIESPKINTNNTNNINNTTVNNVPLFTRNPDDSFRQANFA